MNESPQEIMLDLLCKKAVYGLDAQEERQLDELQREAGIGDVSTSFELTTAAIAMTDVDTSEQMPAHLRSRIMADGEKYLGSRSVTRQDAPRGSMFNWLGWAFAAAAGIALALNIYYTRSENNVATVTPAQMRQQLMETAPDLTRGKLGPADIPELNPAGDVVWSDAKQTGYIRLTGLPKNDPNKETYQLWIVAENQDPKTPVDGGTFDINSDGEVIIPIDAKVMVRNPQAFAITIEKPGGVVVSKNKHAAVAKRET
jgi:anti-sigma-K factor RskA